MHCTHPGEATTVNLIIWVLTMGENNTELSVRGAAISLKTIPNMVLWVRLGFFRRIFITMHSWLRVLHNTAETNPIKPHFQPPNNVREWLHGLWWSPSVSVDVSMHIIIPVPLRRQRCVIFIVVLILFLIYWPHFLTWLTQWPCNI